MVDLPRRFSGWRGDSPATSISSTKGREQRQTNTTVRPLSKTIASQNILARRNVSSSRLGFSVSCSHSVYIAYFVILDVIACFK